MYICDFIVLFLCLVYMICDCKSDACTSELCLCQPKNRAVVCSYRGLTYIPQIPADTQTLYFNDNQLPKIDSHTFNNISGLSNLTDLHLIHDNISVIELNTFSKLRSLKKLTFSRNYLTNESLRNFMTELKQITTLNYLVLMNMPLKGILSGWLQGMEESNLKVINFYNISIIKVNLTEFKTLAKLEHLDLSYNQIMSLTIDKLPRLKVLKLVSNKLNRIPDFCQDEEAFHNLRVLDLSQNQICNYNADNMKCLTKLEILKFNHNCFSVLKSGSFQNLPSLTSLHLAFTLHPNNPLVIEDYAFNNSRLEQLFVDDSYLKVIHIKYLAFAGCPSLQVLDLSYNYLNDKYTKRSGKLSTILSRLVSVKDLYLVNCNLKQLPDSIRNFVTLHTLFLSGNQILTWPDNFWKKTTNLTILALSANMIKSVTQEMFPDGFRHQLKSLGMAYNHIDCICANLWYINWVREKKGALFFGYPKGYYCLNMTDGICLKHNLATFNAIIGLTCFLVSFIVIVSLYYKYKWFIKYQIYIWRHQPKAENNMAAREVLYDVFVSYCNHDEDWIFDYLLPNVESDTTKLCVHKRDFMPGRMIIDNIVEAIEDSRRVLIVLGNEFAKSKWCQFELTLAQNHVLTLDTEPLTVVLLEEVEAEYMTNSIQVLLKTTTYITWCGDQDQDKARVFWERLKYSLSIGVN